MINLPKDFENRIKSRWSDADEFLESYNKPVRKGIRVNTLKISVDDFLKISPFETSPVEWESNGFLVQGEKLGKTALHNAGAYYVQEPSAMSAAPLLQIEKGERVLDLCSAPGGKGTQCAQALDGHGLIVLNEIIFSRAKILSQNVERLGIRNAIVTCASPESLINDFENYFDKIIVDAPCSGEGMFKKEPVAVEEWSNENVIVCAKRQRGILDCAARMLKSSGKLVYSTCTFAEEEDEWQIKDFLSSHGDFTLIKAEKLLPHKVDGEGHFCALMQKQDGFNEWEESYTLPVFKDKKLLCEYKKFESETLFVKFDNLHIVGDVLYSLPNEMPKISVQTLRAGVRLGQFVKGRFVPDQSLASCLKRSEVNGVDVDENQASLYLSGNVVNCDENIKGWCVVFYKGLSLGWGKAVNGILKNHYPKGLRINK